MKEKRYRQIWFPLWAMEIRLFRGLSECLANRNIIFRLYRFSFHKPIKSRLARGRLYLPLTTYKSTTESAALRPLNSGLMQSYPCFISHSFTTLFGAWESMLTHVLFSLSYHISCAVSYYLMISTCWNFHFTRLDSLALVCALQYNNHNHFE